MRIACTPFTATAYHGHRADASVSRDQISPRTVRARLAKSWADRMFPEPANIPTARIPHLPRYHHPASPASQRIGHLRKKRKILASFPPESRIGSESGKTF